MRAARAEGAVALIWEDGKAEIGFIERINLRDARRAYVSARYLLRRGSGDAFPRTGRNTLHVVWHGPRQSVGSRDFITFLRRRSRPARRTAARTFSPLGSVRMGAGEKFTLRAEFSDEKHGEIRTDRCIPDDFPH